MPAAKPLEIYEIYQYPKCSTCRKALRWLEANAIAHRSVDIVAHPPSKATLSKALKLGVELRALFNTSGQSYRQGGFKDKLPNMSRAEALAALTADGKLVKRPLIVGEDFALVGFREDQWRAALLRG